MPRLEEPAVSLLDIVSPPRPIQGKGRRVSSARVLDDRVKAKLAEETDRAYKERLAEGQRRYYQENKERLAEGQRRYREENKERLAEGKRRYYQENKEKWRDVYAKNRRARLKGGNAK
jgi:hypothetical protein